MHQSEAEEPLSSTAKSWMNEVRELCYDTKSYLDDAPFISKQGDDDAQLTPEEKQENAHFEFKMLESRAKNASRRSKRYEIDHKSSNNKTKLPSTRSRLSVLHPQLIDRHRMDKLVSMLGNEEGEPLKIVSLVGLEGVGKTTLAKRLYHQLQAQRGGQFQCGAFVRVSPNPDIRRLLTIIFTQIQFLGFSSSEGVSQTSCCLDAQALIKNIKNYLRDKRYLIIIDDLWTTSVWDIIRRAFPDDGCHSRIVTTTQFEDVASACCSYQSKYKFEMEPLKYDQSRKLFFGMVFGSEDEVSLPEGFGEVASEIIRKCDGLPLSMVNIAHLLPTPSKLNLQQWKDIRDSLPPTLKTNPTSEGMEKVINLIYNNLSAEVKTCLLHLVVYPEGYTSNKDDLVKQWVTEGFTGEGQNNEEIARDYFNELVSRGMIEAVDINYRGVQSCTLHHMVHDFIVKKSMEKNFIIVVDYFQSAILLPNKVRRLSVQFGGARSARIPAGITLSEVQSLAFFGFCGCTDFIEECKLLRVLILHVWADQDKVPFDLSGISKLLPLRYVKIACNIAVKLPAEIQELRHLETLEVDTPVVAIQSGIGGLSRLSSLKIAVSALSRKDICILQALPALSALSLHVWTTPVEMIIFDKGEFLVLKSFELRCHVPWLKFEAGSMPDLQNLSLCFDAREADQHGIVPIGMEHLSGLKEITANIWGSDTNVGSTFRIAVSNHPSNPRIDVQLVDPIFHGDASTSVGTWAKENMSKDDGKVEDEKKLVADIRMSMFPWSKRMFTLQGSSSRVPVQAADKKLKLEIETDGIEVKAEKLAYGREDTADRMSKLKIETENIDDKLDIKFDILQEMDIEHWTPSSPMKTESIDDKLQTKFDILEDKDIEHWMPSSPMKTESFDEMLQRKFDILKDKDIEHWMPSSPMKTKSIDDKLQPKFDILEGKDVEHWMPSSPTNNQTDMKWKPTGWEDKKELADIRMCTSSAGSSSRVPDSGEKKAINSELWHACSGPLVAMPPVGSLIVYFPQGHGEQVAASMHKEVGIIPNYPPLPSKLICKLLSLTLHADSKTDEVYAQMTLQPVSKYDRDAMLASELGLKQNKQPVQYFCKTLTASDTRTHGGFSVPRRAAEKIFPALDFSIQPPVQELTAKDLHDIPWKFRHIFRGQSKRHFLTTGWSVFVSRKRLFAGDSVLFIRDGKSQLLLGIRRATRPQPALSSSVLSSDSMHTGIVAAAAHAAANSSPFTIFINPRASPSEFVIPLAKYNKALYTQFSLGMRFRMLFETEDSVVQRYMGTITGIGDLDPVRWKNSHWRNLQVGWDESTASERHTRVSIWEIEPVSTPFYTRPPQCFRPKLPKQPGMPGPSSVQWMAMQQNPEMLPAVQPPYSICSAMAMQDGMGTGNEDLMRRSNVQGQNIGLLNLQVGSKMDHPVMPQHQQQSHQLSQQQQVQSSQQNYAVQQQQAQFLQLNAIHLQQQQLKTTASMQSMEQHKLKEQQPQGGQAVSQAQMFSQIFQPSSSQVQQLGSGKDICNLPFGQRDHREVETELSSAAFSSQSFGVPDMSFRPGCSSDIAVTNKRMRTFTKVEMLGFVGRSIDITQYTNYNELRHDLACMFGIQGQLEDGYRIGWKIAYFDHEDDILLVGDDPWEEFVNCVKSIRILSPIEVQQMSLYGDLGGIPSQTQDCSASDDANA